MVEKGGLEKDEQQPKNDTIQENGTNSDREMAEVKTQEPVMSGANGNGTPAQPSANSTTETKVQALESTLPGDGPQPSFETQQPEAPQAQDEQGSQTIMGDSLQDQTELDTMGDMDMGDTSLMDDIDMGMDTGDIDFVEHTPMDDDENAIESDTPSPSDPTEVQAPSAPATDTQIPAPSAFEEAEPPQQPVADPQPQSESLPTGTAEDVLAPEPTISADPIVGEAVDIPTMPEDPPIVEGDVGINESAENMFDDGTFDDLTNMDDDGYV